MNFERIAPALKTAGSVIIAAALAFAGYIRAARDFLADWSQRHKNTTAFLLLVLPPLALPTLIRVGYWLVR